LLFSEFKTKEHRQMHFL